MIINSNSNIIIRQNTMKSYSHLNYDNTQSQTSMTEYLTIIRKMHQRVAEEFDSELLSSNLISIIDKAAIKLKTQKEHISILQKQNKDYQNTKVLLTDLKSDQNHLQKRFNQKNDQISILRETIKTLYSDNQRLNNQKQKISKQMIMVKESSLSMKKKLKKQDQEMNKHKIQLEKLTKIAEQRLNQYANQDKQKQKIIKKLTQENQRQKTQISKLNKQIQELKKNNEQLTKIKEKNQDNTKLIDALRYENELCKKQINHLQQSLKQLTEKSSLQTQSYRNEIQTFRQKTQDLAISKKQFQLTNSQLSIKIRSLQEDIMIRTQKLKEKNLQVKQYNEQITKLVERIQNLSIMSDEVVEENRELNQKCKILEERLEEYRILQSYVAKVKGDINYSKSMELAKLIEGLGHIRENI